MNAELTFGEHIHELRKRLMWSLLFVAIGAGVGYALHGVILDLLQHPLSESLYYTTPTGAFSFIIKVCCVFGFIVALPVVVYQIFAFFGPLLPKKSKRSIVWYVFASVILAVTGIAFAYLVSLPAALHFLVNFGEGAGDIQALITADEYFNFVLAYLAGFAALFQLPLVMSFINKITPLKPSQMVGGTRYVILGSFIASAIITPTPDPLNQALMAGPIILLYFLSVLAIIFANKVRRHAAPRTKKKPVQPVLRTEPALADAKSLRLSNPAPVQSIAFSSPKPQVRTQRPAPRRLVTDMIVAPSRSTVPVPARRPTAVRPRRAAVQRPRIIQRPASSRVGLISDFVTASEG